ncbi:MAG: spore coat associated protein CotJA [Lachnospiraceae bacterium]
MNLDYRMKIPSDTKTPPDTRAASEYEHERSLAMAYVPYQQSGEIFGLSEAISKGTIFPELYKPFQKGACGNHE